MNFTGLETLLLTSATGLISGIVSKVLTSRRATKEIDKIKEEFVDKAICTQQHSRVTEQIGALSGKNRILFRMVRALVVYNESIPKEQRKEILNERAD